MGLFGKKKEEEVDEDELIEEEKADRKLTRKFKDLQPENKKKRAEPPKPWGKKERMTILIIFVSTVIISGFLAFSSRESGKIKNPFSSIKSINFDFSSLNIFKEETIEIRKK